MFTCVWCVCLIGHAFISVPDLKFSFKSPVSSRISTLQVVLIILRVVTIALFIYFIESNLRKCWISVMHILLAMVAVWVLKNVQCSMYTPLNSTRNWTRHAFGLKRSSIFLCRCVIICRHHNTWRYPRRYITLLCACVSACLFACVSACVRACVRVCMCVCMCVCVCVCVCVCFGGCC